MFSAKAQNRDEESGAALVSFAARWKTDIEGNRVKAVLRKRIPASSPVEWMYIYVNSPISSVLARALIVESKIIDVREALKLSSDLCLSKEDITRYVGNNGLTGVYHLSSLQLARTPLSVESLRKEMTFFAPQSFLFLSKKAKASIDQKAQFVLPGEAVVK